MQAGSRRTQIYSQCSDVGESLLEGSLRSQFAPVRHLLEVKTRDPTQRRNSHVEAQRRWCVAGEAALVREREREKEKERKRERKREREKKNK